MLRFTAEYAVIALVFCIGWGGTIAPGYAILLYLAVMVVWVPCSIVLLLSHWKVKPKRSVYVEPPPDPIPQPIILPPGPTIEEREQAIELEYQKTIERIDRLALSDDEKRDAKTAAEAEYLRKMSELKE